MRKKHLKKLVLLGVSSAAFMSAQNKALAENAPQQNNMEHSSEQEQNSMSVQEMAFASQLNTQAKQMFDAMSEQARQMAMQTASAGCKGKNTCRGLGGCPTEDNSCKGKNACKGKGGGPVGPNDAVSLVSAQMGQKRANLL
jgi:hypothetical protein